MCYGNRVISIKQGGIVLPDNTPLTDVVVRLVAGLQRPATAKTEAGVEVGCYP